MDYLKLIDVEDFLLALNIRSVSRSGDEWQYSCPFAGHSRGDENPSAYFNNDTALFYCHSCKRSGNAIQFLAELENISLLASAGYIKERYQQGFTDTDSLEAEFNKMFQARREDPIFTVLPEEWAGYFEVPWRRGNYLAQHPSARYMFNRGFTTESLEAWGIGYDEISERITIQIRDAFGNLIGFKGRSWDDRPPKYLMLGDKPGVTERYGFPTFLKSQFVFGLHRVDQESVVICEGELNAIKLDQYFPEAEWKPVALAGSDVSKSQINQITHKATSAIIFLDSDPSGYKGTQQLVDGLSPLMPVRIVDDHKGDPADLTKAECDILITESKNTLDFIFE